MKLMTRPYTLLVAASLSFTLLCIDVSFGQWRSLGAVDGFEKSKNGLIISARPAQIQITVLSPDVIRVRVSTDGHFQPDSSWAVIRQTLGNQSFSVTETKNELKLSTTRLIVRINRAPCRMIFCDTLGTVINQDEPSKGICWASPGEVGVWKTMPENELYYGFGEKAGSLLKNGKMMSMWNSDIPAYRADTDPLYETIPFFYGIRDGNAYGIFLDNTYFSWFNMGKEHPAQYSFGANGGELNYYFIAGPKPIDVLKKFSALVGTMPLPPRWALGYQQCRWSYYPESRVREIASNFRTKHIPCDVIYLDIHYMDGYRCFTWDKQRFPDPKTMVSDLAKDGFKMVVIIDPGIKNDSSYWVYNQGLKGDHFMKYPDGRYFIGPVWPGPCVFPDFTRSETRSWWGSLYKELVETGVKGFWNDMNEPSVFEVPTKTFDLTVVHDDYGLKTDH
ncbi:MAG: DUF4968 domain-containing protein [Ignavibacteria bacterium]|nr:DUF4968 domain-containing protein [Ignavibacteria bacterium]